MVAAPQELALAPLPLKKQASLAVVGSVLVGGGLGEIGQLAGHWVAAAHGSSHVWMLGRSGRSAQSMTAALQQHAGSVSMAAGDVTARDDMAGLMQALATSGAPAVSGVLHAGAVLADALLGRQTAASLRAVFAPKVPGALCLLGATSAMPLQGLLHFSSLTAQLGTPGQSNYAAANGALDGVAQDYLNRGLQSSSVMWGPWASGMALSDAGLLERFQQAGLGAISGGCGEWCGGKESRLTAAAFVLLWFCAFVHPGRSLSCPAELRCPPLCSSHPLPCPCRSPCRLCRHGPASGSAWQHHPRVFSDWSKHHLV
jgi:hypothetical protein